MPRSPDPTSDAASRHEKALRAILAVRLDTTPGVTLEQAVNQARIEMREIAKKALRDVQE